MPLRSRARTRSAALVGGLIATLALLGAVSDDAAADDAGAKPSNKNDAGADARAKIPPDPPALSERTQWVFDLRWQRGDVYLVQTHKIDMGSPQPTPRMMGRFALELYEGPTLIERVRFDFPMLGAPEEGDAGWKGTPRFEPLLKTRIGVLFPATKRGTRLELWDRALDKRWPLPWPAEERTYADPAPGPSPKDAGRG